MNPACFHSFFKGMPSIVLENSHLRCEWLPGYGSKLASLIAKGGSGTRELLYQARTEKLTKPPYGATFSDYDLSGFDECFPTITECAFPGELQRSTVVPDHGELWTAAWEVLASSSTEITFRARSQAFGYQLTKSIALTDNRLTSHYQLTLLEGRKELPFIWTPHALFNPGANTQLLIPAHMNEIITVTDHSGELGQQGAIHSYPRTTAANNKVVDISKIEDRLAQNCEKFYFTSTLKPEDQFGFMDDQHRVLMTVDTDKVLYLGIWKNQGGYMNDYNFALEPCTGIYDSLYDAYSNNRCATITEGETCNWYFVMQIEAL
ncbi:MAG: DUF5107 domain-containing protein [Gammaproteobacteria bacterium]|nr:DUF5107 domain-containing protein [Gammaproteobacteria bacterium]